MSESSISSVPYMGLADDEAEPVASTPPPVPDVDVAAAAAECKAYLEKKKFDLVDYSFVNIECYPPPDSDEYPLLKSFAAKWTEVFDYADRVVEDDAGTGFPHLLVADFETKTKEIEAAVNSDTEFWTALRSVVLPLYEKSKFYEEWKRRWNKIDLFYDPIGLEATTTEIFTNKETGERIRGDVKRTTRYDAGFVIRIDGRFDTTQQSG